MKIFDCAFDLDCIDGRCQTPGGDKTGSTFEKIFMGPYYGQTRTSGKKERDLTVKRKKINLIERKGNLPFVKKKEVEEIN